MRCKVCYALTVAVLVQACPSPRAPAVGTATSPTDPIGVAPTMLVSGALPDWEHLEYTADADPRDPNRVMVCSMMFSPARNSMRDVLYVSLDGGKRWDIGYRDSTHADMDPACTYGVAGDAFFATLMDGLPIRRSMDGGRTWTGPRFPPQGPDNAALMVDRGGGRFHGRMYIHASTDSRNLWLMYSADSGKSFIRSAETTLKGREATKAGRGAVLPDGTLLLPYYVQSDSFVHEPESEPGKYVLAVAASHDGGAHLTAPVAVGDRGEMGAMALCVTEELSAGHRLYRASDYPFFASLAADQSAGPFRGRGYIMWTERYRGRCSVFLAYSDNAGESWSEPIHVSDELPSATSTGGPDQFLPILAVNNVGVVGVTWYDRREDPRNRNHRLRFSASVDGGLTWLPSVPVSTAPFTVPNPPRYTPWGMADLNRDVYSLSVVPLPALSDEGGGGMHYSGIAAGADGRFHAFWIDNRTGVRQMYSAAVTVAATPMLNGSVELAHLEPLTQGTAWMDITSTSWDPATRMVGVAYTLRNTSRDTIVVPLKLRVTRVSSDLGPASLVLANGAPGGPGTVLDISAALPSGRLAPGATTAPQQLHIGIDTVDSLERRRGFADQLDIAHIDARLFVGKVLRATRSPDSASH